MHFYIIYKSRICFFWCITSIVDDLFTCLYSISELYRINEYVSTVIHITFGQITWFAETFFDYLCSAWASGFQTGLNNRNRLPLDWLIFPLKSHLLNSTSSTQMTSFPLDVDNATVTFTCAQRSQENSGFRLYWAWSSRWPLQMYRKNISNNLYIIHNYKIKYKTVKNSQSQKYIIF